MATADSRYAFALETFDLHPTPSAPSRSGQATRGTIVELTPEEFEHFKKIRLVTEPHLAPQPNLVVRAIPGPDFKDYRLLVLGGGWYQVVDKTGQTVLADKVQGRDKALKQLARTVQPAEPSAGKADEDAGPVAKAAKRTS